MGGSHFDGSSLSSNKMDKKIENLTGVLYVLLNLLNEFWKSDKMRGLLCILLLFFNKFDQFSNTRAQMVRFYLSITLKLL